MSGYTVTLLARTDVGLVRAANEDHIVIGDLDAGLLFELGSREEVVVADDGRGPVAIVCDGMGGGEFGGEASRVAAQTAWRELAREKHTAERPVFARQLRRSVRAANLAVREHAKTLASAAMGTTAAVAGLVDRALVLALVGDCRAYIFRQDMLTQVTRDQSVVSALVSAGTLTDEQARSSERRHMILQALGPSPDVEVSLSLVELRQGDALLLSSDGLHGVLDDHYIAAALKAHAGDLDGALARLFDLVAAAGAPDNVSVVLCRFDGDGLPPVGPNDSVPRFTEIDPQEDGEAALTATSRVARRLAHRAGLRDKSSAPPVPATGTYAVLTVPIEHSPASGGAEVMGPAEARLAAQAGLSPIWWLIAGAALALISWALFAL